MALLFKYFIRKQEDPEMVKLHSLYAIKALYNLFVYFCFILFLSWTSDNFNRNCSKIALILKTTKLKVKNLHSIPSKEGDYIQYKFFMQDQLKSEFKSEFKL